MSDRVHDAYFVFSFLRALDQVDALKSAAPMLGTPVTLDYDAARAAAHRTTEPQHARRGHRASWSQYLSGMFIWGHPRAQINVVPSPTIPSIIGGLLPSIYNPNLVSEESSRRVSLAEVEAIAMTAALVGYDPARADGVFTFGGTGHAAVRREDRTRKGRAATSGATACSSRPCSSARTARTTPA